MTSTSELARGHHVSLRRQLAAGLEAAIRDGHLGAGSALPSTRQLAREAGLHRSTVSAAYARLRRRGWIEGGTGERARVAPSRPSGAGGVPSTVAPRIASAFEAARADGRPRADVVRELCRLASRLRVGREGTVGPCLFEPRPGLGRALRAELERRVGVPVAVSRGFPREVVRRGGTVLIRAELRARVLARHPECVDAVGLSVGGGTRERAFVRRLLRGGLVTLVSVSGAIRRYGAELAAREFHRGVSYRAVSPEDAAAAIRAVAAANLVLYDEPSRRFVMATAARTLPIRLLSDADVASLRSYFGAAERPVHAPLGRPGTGANARPGRGSGRLGAELERV